MVVCRSFVKFSILTAFLTVGAAIAAPAEARDRTADRWAEAIARLSAPFQQVHDWLSLAITPQAKEGANLLPGGKEGASIIPGGKEGASIIPGGKDTSRATPLVAPTLPGGLRELQRDWSRGL
jgi:hypothetical protein